MGSHAAGTTIDAYVARCGLCFFGAFEAPEAGEDALVHACMVVDANYGNKRAVRARCGRRAVTARVVTVSGTNMPTCCACIARTYERNLPL